MVFSLVVVGFAPATAATVSRLDSAPGQSQSDWEATDAYKAFTCPEGTLRGGGVDLNFTTDRSDDKYFVTCDEPSPTAADDADFSKRTREATSAAEVESIAYSAANPGKQKCVQWGPIVHRNGISTSSGGVCANIVGVASTSETPTVTAPSVTETVTAPTPTPTASSTSRIPYTQPCTGGTDRTPGLPQCLMPEGIGGSVWNLVDNNSGVVLNGAVCSEGVCGRNGEWRQWPADRKLNDRLWPTGYPEEGTYIQTPFDYGYWGRYFTNGVYEVNGGGIIQPGSRTIVWPVQTPVPGVDTRTVTSETSTSVVTPETSTPIYTPSPTPTPTPTPTATPAPLSEPRGLGGYAVIHPDGHVCGVIVGNAYFGNNDRTMTSEYMGCPVGSPIIFQTKPSPTGNVAGWHGSNVTYSSGVFTITNSGQVAMTISDGIATDSTGRMWDTGSGATLRAATVITPPTPTQGESSTATSAPSSTIIDTRTATTRIETATVTIPVSIPAADEDLSTLDEIFPEEEIIDSIDAVVQSNGTTRIQVSTGYNLAALTVVATKKGSKKKYTYKITTNTDGERKFKSGINLRGYTVVLLKGSTELDRMYIS